MKFWVEKVEAALGRALSEVEQLLAGQAYAEGIDIGEFIDVELSGWAGRIKIDS